MLQLALETIGHGGSLAILDGESVCWKLALPPERRAAAELAVQLDAALQWCRNADRTLDAVSVAVGPGSFTGLRIGITTAKTLAYALNLPVIPLGSLAAIARTTATECPADGSPPESILVGLNAYRNQVFQAEFSLDELLSRQPSAPPVADWAMRAELVDRSEWDQRLKQTVHGHPCWITGDRSIFPAADEKLFHPRREVDAVGAGLIAARIGASPDGRQDAFSLAARYLKQSAAEEKAAATKSV